MSDGRILEVFLYGPLAREHKGDVMFKEVFERDMRMIDLDVKRSEDVANVTHDGDTT